MIVYHKLTRLTKGTVMSELKVVSLASIRENPVALRPVNREHEDYQGLVASIKEKGFVGAISVTEKTDPDSGEMFFELVDGLHRFNAAKDAGLESINVDVVVLDEVGVLEFQLMANTHKIETRPAEFSAQLKRMLAVSPMLTEAELANKLGKSPAWLQARLKLNKIENSEILDLINEGKIVLSNAFALASLPSDEQADFVDRAMSMSPTEFIPQAKARVKEIREARRQGRDEAASEFTASPHAQKLSVIKSEYENSEVAGLLCDGLSTAAEGFAMGVAWVLNMDPQSVDSQRARHDERVAKKADAKKKRDAEKAAKKAKKAAEAAVAAEEAAQKLAEDE